jgi:hypothetical protein
MALWGPIPTDASAGIVRSMFPPRTQVYEGLYPSQIRERFEEDAQEAAAHDWYPVNESWRGADLYVTYAHDPWRNKRVAVAEQHEPSQQSRRRMRLSLRLR